MNVNFELYKVFYYVGKTLSFSEAAKQLYISQSAVSQSIKLLEEKLGTRLFFRHTKTVKLTPEGKMFFQYIEQAYHFIRTGEKNIQEIHSLKKGEVRIGASDTICKYYLLPYFKKFHEMYPDIKIHVINRPSPVCVELLKKGTVDVSVVNLCYPFSYKDLYVQEIKKIKDVFIAGKSFNDLQNQKLSLKELQSYPLLMLEKNSTTRTFFEDLLKKYQLSMTPEFELSSVDLLIELTKIGLGISFVMEDVVKHEVAKNEVFILDIIEKIPTRSVGIITQRNIPLSMAAQKFVDLFSYADSSS